jgi:hypothetical protein
MRIPINLVTTCSKNAALDRPLIHPQTGVEMHDKKRRAQGHSASVTPWPAGISGAPFPWLAFLNLQGGEIKLNHTAFNASRSSCLPLEFPFIHSLECPSRSQRFGLRKFAQGCLTVKRSSTVPNHVNLPNTDGITTSDCMQ